MNLFDLPLPLPDDERCEILCGQATGLRIERIVSNGQVTPPGSWYDQELDEWVTVLQGEAELEYPDGRRCVLRPGDTVFIPRHERHRVSRTSQPCLWLAVHGDLI